LLFVRGQIIILSFVDDAYGQNYELANCQCRQQCFASLYRSVQLIVDIGRGHYVILGKFLSIGTIPDPE
jgi:hypothetical protein